VYTNEILMKCKLSDTEMCTFCFEAKETMTHFFLLLNICSSLMACICTMLQNKCGITIDVTPETCILGMLSGDHFNIINTCIIIMKYFIFTCKLQNTTPVFRECVEQIKYYKKLDFDFLYLCTH
jgi:hypothetical protein